MDMTVQMYSNSLVALYKTNVDFIFRYDNECPNKSD